MEGYHAASAISEVAVDPAEVERGAELERLLRHQDGEGQVRDGVHDEAGGDQGEGRAVGAAAADDQQQGHRREDDVEQREQQHGEPGVDPVGGGVEQLGVDEDGGDDQDRGTHDQAVERHHQQVDAAAPDAGEVQHRGDRHASGRPRCSASPMALGESTGSAPMTVTQTLAATASRAATTRSCHDRRRRPVVCDGAQLAADGGDHAAQQEPGAAGGLAGLLREQGGLEQHREDDPERGHHRDGHHESPSLGS